MPILTNPRLMLLSATLPTVAFAVALSQTLHPALPDWAIPRVDEVMSAPVIAPFYLELETPLQLGLMGGRVQLSVNLAFSARLGPMDLLDLSTRVKDREQPVLAALSNDLLAATNADQDVNRLRQVLPAIFRDTVNQILGTDALPIPVDEVLIMEISLTAG